MYPMSAIKQLMNGDMILKKQYGRYVMVGTPNTVAWVIPHVFQGIRTDVTVAESSADLDSKRPSCPIFLYTSLYIEHERIIEMYWSLVTMFRSIPVQTVDATRPNVLRMKRMTTEVMLWSIPLATITPPKHMAQRMSQMVLSIPAIPPVDTRSLRVALPVSTFVDVKNVIITPFIRLRVDISVVPATSSKIFGCKMSAKMPATIEDANKVIIEGTFFAIRMAVKKGTSNVHKDMLNVLFRPSV